MNPPAGASTLGVASQPIHDTIAEHCLTQVRGILEPTADWPGDVVFYPQLAR